MRVSRRAEQQIVLLDNNVAPQACSCLFACITAGSDDVDTADSPALLRTSEDTTLETIVHKGTVKVVGFKLALTPVDVHKDKPSRPCPCGHGQNQVTSRDCRTSASGD
ncbi:MAG: hypothetical protein IPO31_16390 [Candidatus Obscuribacter sp.]|nr:hypothetical protein [Candidatus Obscuribacter sp.]